MMVLTSTQQKFWMNKKLVKFVIFYKIKIHININSSLKKFLYQLKAYLQVTVASYTARRLMI